jgi:hypothetical protein
MGLWDVSSVYLPSLEIAEFLNSINLCLSPRWGHFGHYFFKMSSPLLLCLSLALTTHMLEVLIFCPMDHGVFISFKTLVFPLFFKLDLSILFVCFVFGGTGV